MTETATQILAESLAKSAGIQLYTVGKELKEDMAGNLAELAAIGYRVSGKRRNGREDDHGPSESARCPRHHASATPGGVPGSAITKDGIVDVSSKM